MNPLSLPAIQNRLRGSGLLLFEFGVNASKILTLKQYMITNHRHADESLCLSQMAQER